MPFRPDREHVITPVVDFLTARDDIDARRLALAGISQGGYWVPRALAFEHRLAGTVRDMAPAGRAVRRRVSLRPAHRGLPVHGGARGGPDRHPSAPHGPEGEHFWPGASRRLYDALPGPKELVSFSAAEGAHLHCEPTGRALVEQRVFDWLEARLPGSEGQRA
ncbi:alpha/beta hydrolase family protein [Streptomyces kronopolitis]|uniref:alpha/beta hydrolase family protein n=1 Tax=Streptomyces kronopolitis TaxID=1612435 RepID=UPI003D9711B7